MKPRSEFILLSIAIPVIIFALAAKWQGVLWLFIFITPLIVIGYADLMPKKQSIKRNFPVIGNLRYLLEKIRPEIMQYFVETDTEGRPINRIQRSIVYQRAKNVNDTTPFGTQMDVYKAGYEWMDHSIYAKPLSREAMAPRVLIGGKGLPSTLQRQFVKYFCVEFWGVE